MGTILCDNSFQDNQWLPYQSMHSPPSLSSQTPHSHGWLSVRWPRPASWPWSLSSSTSSANLEGKRKWTTFWPVSTALSNSACVHTPSTNVFSVSAITWNQCFVHRMHVMLCSITTTSCLEVSTPFRGIPCLYTGGCVHLLWRDSPPSPHPWLKITHGLFLLLLVLYMLLRWLPLEKLYYTVWPNWGLLQKQS